MERKGKRKSSLTVHVAVNPSRLFAGIQPVTSKQEWKIRTTRSAAVQSSVGIRERIDHVYPSLRPAERAVAQYIRNHIEEAADLTVGQMADIAHVSQPTVIRFARKLGFGG